MNEQDKQVLLKDICARLPYHVRVKVWLKYGYTKEGSLELQRNYGDVLRDAFYYNKITKIKPYLRPMSSMTEEELKWYYNKLTTIEESRIRRQKHIEELNNWLNAHHFDYRGLIEKGLALEALEGMYNINNTDLKL